jgi:hypothetical protein
MYVFDLRDVPSRALHEMQLFYIHQAKHGAILGPVDIALFLQMREESIGRHRQAITVPATAVSVIEETADQDSALSD